MKKLVAIASGKGGTGKTSISVNLAALLSEMQELNYQQITLTDLDVEEPNSSLFFTDAKQYYQETAYRMVPEWDSTKCTLCNKCSQVCEFNALAFLGTRVLVFPDLCHACHACSLLCPENALPMKQHRMGEMTYFKPRQKNLILAEYRLDIGQPSAVPLIKDAITHIESMASEHNLFILDAPPGNSCPMMEVSKSSDFVILVTEPTPFGLHDLKIAVDTVRKLERPLAVVLNKSGSGNDAIINEYCEQEKIEIIGKIPQSREIAEAYSRGELVYNINSEIRQAWSHLMDNLLVKLEQI
jgi:MinD superfamily P-loop ATPase